MADRHDIFATGDSASAVLPRKATIPVRLRRRDRFLSGNIRATLRYIRSIAAVLLVWHLLALWIGNHVLLPAPDRVARSMYRLWAGGDFIEDYLLSAQRLLTAYGAAALAAVTLGVTMGLNRIANEFLDPVVELLRPISALAWIPLWLAVIGISSTLPYFVIFYVALFPFLLNTIGGVRGADPLLIRAASTMGVSARVIVRRVVLPDALPSVLTGARLAMGGAWMALIASELIGSPNGLGFSILFFGATLRTADMIAVIAVVAFSGYLTDLLLRLLQRRLTPWKA
ncbi:MAG: ABC transporter permease [bacterium]|nr:ABC transporter permease [bacterium]MDE0438372.1 ABC transporter permease [bacterium]